MGSWNETCGLSNLPIKRGDEVVLFLLKPNKEKITGGTGYTSTKDFFTPVSIPVHAVYNDYGSVEEISKNEAIVFNMVSKTFDMEISNLPEEKKPENLEDLINLIERSEFTALSFVMFHKDIYLNVLKEVGERIPYGVKETVKETLIKQANECIEKNEEIEKELKEELKGKEEKEKERIKAFKSFMSGRKVKELNSFSRMLTGYDSEMNDWFEALLDEPEDKDFLNELVYFHIICIVMDHGRKTWMPQTGSGSQSAEMSIQETIADSIKAHVKAYKKEVMEDSYYEEEEIEGITKETIWIR